MNQPAPTWMIADAGSSVSDYAPFVGLVIVGVILAAGGAAVLRRWSREPDGRQRHRKARLRIQAALAVGGVLLGLLLILTFPTDSDVEDSLLTFYGVLIAAVIGLTSTTYVSNFLAGLILSNRASFSDGDFVRSGELLGAVVRQRLLHTEIETEDGESVLIPNLRMVTEPLSIMRVEGFGIVVSTKLSLGYDVASADVKRLLIEAAKAAHLTLPFAYVTSLGDFAVTYRAGGRLVKGVAASPAEETPPATGGRPVTPRPAAREDSAFPIIATRSLLREQILDHLHGAGIEIVSPTFMNQRQLAKGDRFVSRVTGSAAEVSDVTTDVALNPETVRTRDIKQLESREADLVSEITSLQEAAATGGASSGRGSDRLALAEQELAAVKIEIEAAKAAKDEG